MYNLLMVLREAKARLAKKYLSVQAHKVPLFLQGKKG